jgi:hypothetical protein
MEELMPPMVFPEITYAAVYNPDSGEVMRIGPATAFINEKHQVALDKDTALQIIEGKIRITSCMVNVYTKEFEIAEIKTAYRMDDVLHRIPDVQWADIENPEIYLTYDAGTLTFELSKEFGGTKVSSDRPITVIRRTLWEGDTTMNFFITDYNDPNVLHKTMSIKIIELMNTSKVYKDLNIPKRFSVYTRRLFKKYVMEIK